MPEALSLNDDFRRSINCKSDSSALPVHDEIQHCRVPLNSVYSTFLGCLFPLVIAEANFTVTNDIMVMVVWR